MKQRLPTFEEMYSDQSNDNTRKGFVPYRKDGKYVHSLMVEMIADRWASGAMLVLNVYECIDSYKKASPILSKVAYNNHYHDSELDYLYISPTLDQQALISALSSGDLRGKYAEEIASLLYVDLFVLNPKSGLREILPDVVKEYERRWAEYGWTLKSK